MFDKVLGLSVPAERNVEIFYQLELANSDHTPLSRMAEVLD